MEFTYNQKMSIVRLLLDIIRVDGKIDARETFLFEEIKKELFECAQMVSALDARMLQLNEEIKEAKKLEERK